MPERLLTRAVRRQVASRAGHRCEYCHTPEACSVASFTVDHIQPQAAGGTHDLENLAWACAGCNAAKHVRQRGDDPVSAGSAALFNPRRQIWREHFAWSEDGLEILGITGTGRATVNAMVLNRPGLMNLREMLDVVGRHPRYAT